MKKHVMWGIVFTCFSFNGLQPSTSAETARSQEREPAAVVPELELFFKKPEKDWSANINLTRVRAANEYDVIVVGSGVGGLMAAALLANKGYHVLVLERDHQVGGYCVSYKRNNFWFTAGVEDISGLWEGALARKHLDILLKNIGLKFDDLFERNRPLFVHGDKRIDLSDPNKKVENVLAQHWPSKTQELTDFFEQTRRTYENVYRGVRSGIWFEDKNYQQILDTYFPKDGAKNDQIQEFLRSLIGYLGDDAESIPAPSALHGCLGYLLKGGYYVKGEFNGKHGAGAFSQVLAYIVEKNNGTIKTNARITSIDIDTVGVFGGRFFVHAADGTIYESPVVLLNANARTGLKLFPQLAALSDEVDQLKMSHSGVLIHFGVNKDLITSKPTLAHGYSMSLQLLEPGKTSIGVILDTPVDLPERTEAGSKKVRQEYKDYKEKLAQQWREKLPKVLKDVTGQNVTLDELIFGDVATKYTFERYTGMPDGAWYSLDRANEKKLYFKTPVHGLYIVGASSSGGGIEAVMITAIKCAEDIMR